MLNLTRPFGGLLLPVIRHYCGKKTKRITLIPPQITIKLKKTLIIMEGTDSLLCTTAASPVPLPPVVSSSPVSDPPPSQNIDGETEGVEKKEGTGTEEEITKDPSYAYLKRDEFTSELYKIEVRGLPKYFGFNEIKKLLNNRLSLNSHKIKLGGISGLMYVTFKSEEDKQKALEVLNGFVWKKKTLSAEVAKAAKDPIMAKKRPIEQVDNDEPSGFVQDENIEEAMLRVTVPWSKIPYEEQLQKKMEQMNTIVSDITKKIKEANSTVKLDPESSKICPVDMIKASPVTTQYRNKCEFSVGYHPLTNEKMVGFRASSYKEGSIAVGPVDHLIHLPVPMVKVASAFQDFVRRSDIQPFDRITHEGCWKQLTVRTTTSGEVMLIVHVVSSKTLGADGMGSLETTITDFFSSLTDPKISSCFIRIVEEHGQQSKNVPKLLFGNDYITEEALGLQFRISAEAFFQVNVPATEVLYSTVGALLESNPESTVLDVCCGTGTIGISVAEKCSQIIGIEMVESAVEDAKKNAAINGLTDKCEFLAGKAENMLEVALMKAKFENIVAIVDPPRGGLHNKVLQLLRRCEKIKRIVYVSCDPKLAMKNFVDLARPPSKTYKGNPFLPIKIIPVDMFPHCPQGELVLLFERSESKTS